MEVVKTSSKSRPILTTGGHHDGGKHYGGHSAGKYCAKESPMSHGMDDMKLERMNARHEKSKAGKY